MGEPIQEGHGPLCIALSDSVLKLRCCAIQIYSRFLQLASKIRLFGMHNMAGGPIFLPGPLKLGIYS